MKMLGHVKNLFTGIFLLLLLNDFIVWLVMKKKKIRTLF